MGEGMALRRPAKCYPIVREVIGLSPEALAIEPRSEKRVRGK